MLWLSFILSFYGFICVSGCLSLTWSDITMGNNHLVIELCQSKTDLFVQAKGQSIHIYPTNLSTCPLRALMRLFIDKIGTTPPHKLVFFAGTFSPLIRSKLTEIIRYLLIQAGMCPSNYTSHIFTIGAVTTAAAARLPNGMWLIKTLGRWSSDAYLTYVHCPTM